MNQNRMPSVCRWITVCVAGMLLVAGCKTSGRRESLSIRMLPDGGCVVADRVIPADQLNAALKSAGAGKDTRVRVTLPPDASEEDMRQFARRLSAAGYRMIHFETPRKAISYAGSEPPPGPPRR